MVLRKTKVNSNIFHNLWCYEQQDLGFNYRISEIHAALGLSQLKRLKELSKKEIDNTYIT